MASASNVSFTADITDVTAKLAVLTQQWKQQSSAVRAAANEIIAAGAPTSDTAQRISQLGAAAGQTKGQINELRSSMSQLPEVEHHVAEGSAGITRELLVMTHETMQGRFKNLIGSMVVLAERTGGLHTVMAQMSGGMIAAVGAAGALGYALISLAHSAYEAEENLRGVYNAAQMQGRGAQTARDAALAGARAMNESGTISRTNALTITAAIQSIANVSNTARDGLMALGTSLNVSLGMGDTEKTAEELHKIFGSGGSLKTFVDTNHLLSVETKGAAQSQQALFDAALKNGNLYAAQEIAVQGLSARYAESQTAYEKMVREQQSSLEGTARWVGALASGAVPVLGNVINMVGNVISARRELTNTPTMLMQPNLPELKVPADDSTARLTYEAEQKSRDTQNQRAAIQADINRLKDKERTLTDLGARAQEEANIKVLEARRDAIIDPGQTSWAEQIAHAARGAADAAEESAFRSGKKRIAITEAGVKAELAIYDKAAHDMTRSDKEREDAASHVHQLHMQLIKDEATISAQGAKQGLEAALLALDAKQAAYKNDFAGWMRIEQQKLNLSRGNVVETARIEKEAAEYRERSYERGAQAAVKLASAETAAGLKSLDATRARLGQMVADEEITQVRRDEMDRQATMTAYQEALHRQADLVHSLTEGTAAYEGAFDQWKKMAADFGDQMARVQEKIAQDIKKQTKEEAKDWEHLFDNVNSEGERLFADLATRSTTWAKAEGQMLRTVLTDFAGITTKMVEQWAVMEMERALTDRSAMAQIETQQAAGGTGFMTLVKQMLGLSVTADAAKVAANATAESAQTASHAAGVSTRKGVDAAAHAEENSWFLARVVKWIATELGMTSASTAQAGTRTAVQAAADAATQTAAMTSNVATAMSYAAVGAAAAGQSVAAIPYVGWAMAPGVSAATYAELSGFAAMASLDTGTMNVPHDMIAHIHQGEMVVPRPFAEGIRSSMGNSSSSSATVNAHFAPVINGGGAGIQQHLANQFEDFKSYMWNVSRNGNLQLPFR